MSGFLEGLVRRGAGLGAAPGEQTATLRPLSRFELRPFDGAEGASAALPESESFAPAATRHAGHESVPVQERETTLHSPAAPVLAPDEHPSPAPAPVMANPAIATARGEPDDVGRAQASPPAAPAQPLPAQTPAERMPAPETLAVPAPAGPQAQVTHDNTPDITGEVAHDITHAVTRREEVTHLAPAAPLPRVAATSPQLPHPAPDTRLPGEEPDVPVHHAAMVPAAPDQSPRAVAPASTPRQHESHDAPAPQTSITIGRIEIDFGQKPAAPPPSPRPQRTRGFAAYARARRGQAR